jgi:uncharacterized protein YbjT (DUF2867 family)
MATGEVTPMAQRAIVFGATGLIGGHVATSLVTSSRWTSVITIGRRAPAHDNPKLKTITCELSAIDGLSKGDSGPADAVFCCLGTTQAKAETIAAFQAVDRDAVIATARFAARIGAGHFLLVSAVGADPTSRILYNRTKGEAEIGVAAFADRLAISIFRPSLLLGARAEFRWKERVSEPAMRVLAPVMVGSLSKYRPVDAHVVAAAMVAIAERPVTRAGVSIYEGNAITAVTRTLTSSR